MKKLLVFGIRSKFMLEDVQQINSEYQIIGFTDFNYNYVRKEFSYLPFYEVNEIGKVDFDYVIILAKTKEDNEKKYNVLMDNNISPKKILPYFYWGGFEKMFLALII